MNDLHDWAILLSSRVVFYSVTNLSMTQVVNQYAKDLQNGGNRAEEIAKHLGNGDAEKGKEVFYKEVHKSITDVVNFFFK